MKKILLASVLVLCFLFVGTAYAKDVYRETFTDAKTGRQIEYFDMGEDTTRPYFTQNAWFSDNQSFIVLSEPEKRIYKYDTLSGTVVPMFSAGCLPLSSYAVVGPDDTVYATNNTDGNLYAQNGAAVTEEEDTPNYEEVSFEVNSAGTGYTGALDISIWSGSYDRDIGYSAADGKSAVGGKHYVYNREFTGTPTWKQWKNAFYFKVPDTFLYGSDYSTVEVEVEYYAPTNCTMELLAKNSSGTDTKVSSTSVTSGAWKTHKFTISSGDGKDIVFSNRFDSSADFRIGFDAQGYVHKVTLRKFIDTDSGNKVDFEVNTAGTGYTGALDISIWSGSYDRDIGYSATDGKAAIDGKHYVYNKEFTGTPTWKQWKNAFYFKVPDDFIYGADYSSVEIEVEYYVPANSTIELVARNASGSDVSVGSSSVTSGAWNKKTFAISSADGKGIVFSNKFDSSADFRINFDKQGYVHKVTLKKTDILNLGSAQGGWLPHVSSNGDLSLTTGHNNKIVIYEANNQRFASADIGIYSTHAMINPVYPNLVLYSEEGTSETTFGRIRMFDRNNMSKKVIFEQYSNLSNGATTGEAVGHEGWSGNGEHIVAVKYDKSTNIGKSGIIRMDKDGNNREYLNDDYKYWHCAASYDGRWIVADTVPASGDLVNIVLIDAKTGKSYLVAKQRGFVDDPGQPHPSFNLDGTKVTFAMARRKLNASDENYVMGVGIADVSNIVNDGQLGEPADPTDYKISPFEIGFNKDAGRNEVKTRVTNIDGVQRDMNLYAGVFDSQGRLISAGKSRYDSSADGTLTAEIRDTGNGETVKCFMWDDNMNPVSNHVDTVKNIRAAKVGANEVVLSWQDDSDMPAIKYEVYRGGQKIGETPYTVYRDSGLTKETQYTYYIRPVYSGIAIGEDASYASADVDGLDFDGIYSVLERPCKNYGLTFLENDNLAFDSYTEFKVKDGESCRMARQVREGEEDDQGNKRWGSTYDGMFYFDCDRSVITADTNNVLIGVRYYDNREGVNLSIDYKKTDGTTGSKTVVTKTGTDTWKTATVLLDDAKFVDSSEINGHDFRFQGGYSMYISRVWAIPLDGNGNRISRGGSGSPIVGGQAGVKVTTRGESVSATLVGNEITENGLHFTLNGSDNSVDGYTEATNEGGRDCRQNTSAAASMFCFNVNKDIIPEDVTAIDVTVEYYGYNYNGGKIQLKYTATDGTTKTKDVASPSSSSWSSSAKQWKTATVSITDAKLIGGLNRGSDLVIKPTGKSTKIYSVTVTKKSTPSASPLQYIEWNASTDSGSGLSRISGGQISGDNIYVHSVNDWLKFSVDDLYLYGKSNNAVWVDITYKDSGTSNIYLYYNTSDPTVAAPKADKLAETVITCEGTGLYKTVSIPLIDANFSNYDGYDFRIVSDNGAYIKNVKVVGY